MDINIDINDKSVKEAIKTQDEASKIITALLKDIRKNMETSIAICNLISDGYEVAIRKSIAQAFQTLDIVNPGWRKKN